MIKHKEWLIECIKLNDNIVCNKLIHTSTIRIRILHTHYSVQPYFRLYDTIMLYDTEEWPSFKENQFDIWCLAVSDSMQLLWNRHVLVYV